MGDNFEKRGQDSKFIDIRRLRTSLTAGMFRLSRSKSFSRRRSRREMLSSREAGFAGGVGSPVQLASPVRRYVRCRRRVSRSSIVAPATVSFSRAMRESTGIVDVTCEMDSRGCLGIGEWGANWTYTRGEAHNSITNGSADDDLIITSLRLIV